MNEETDFWGEAQAFLKTQVPENFEENLINLIKEKGYNANETRLFNNMLKEAVGFVGTIAFIKTSK